jgi:hypothetical protein
MPKNALTSKTEGGITRLTVPSQIATFSYRDQDLVFTIPGFIGETIHDFLLTPVTHENRFAVYRKLFKLDAEVKIGTKYISFMIQRNYLGPRLDLEDKDYSPNQDFLLKCAQILSELNLTSCLYDLVQSLTMNGVAFLRLYRTEVSDHPERTQITKTEFIPPDGMTIISEAMVKKPKQKPNIIMDADYFILNERHDRSSTTGEYAPYLLPGDPTAEGVLPGMEDFGEQVFSKKEMLYLSVDSNGNDQYDALGRRTFGVWGSSPYETLLYFSKAKLMLHQDHLEWVRLSMPRQDVTVDMADLLDISQYTGDTLEEKLTKARARLRTEFDNIAESFYYRDTNTSSKTADLKMPLEPGDLYIHDKSVTVNTIGGGSLPLSIKDQIQEANRSISSVLGVPMTLLGYEAGSTYAVSYITEGFMSGFGGGLLRTVEGQIKEFLRNEFIRRNWAAIATADDWEHLYLEYKVDNPEQEKGETERNNAKIQGAYSLTLLVNALMGSQIITKNQALSILRDGITVLEHLPPVEGGDSFAEPAAPEAQTPVDSTTKASSTSPLSGFKPPEIKLPKIEDLISADKPPVLKAQAPAGALTEIEPELSTSFSKALKSAYDEFVRELAIGLETSGT